MNFHLIRKDGATLKGRVEFNHIIEAIGVNCLYDMDSIMPLTINEIKWDLSRKSQIY